MRPEEELEHEHCVEYILTLQAQNQSLQQKIGWRCFFCDFFTQDKAVAAAHFGDLDDPEEFKPICKWWQRMSAEEKVETLQSYLQELNGERDENTALQQQVEALQVELNQCRETKLCHKCQNNSSLREQVARLTAALTMLYDKYESGDPCTENGDEFGSVLGNCVRLSSEEEDEILKLIPGTTLLATTKDAEESGLR